MIKDFGKYCAIYITIGVRIRARNLVSGSGRGRKQSEEAS